MRSIDHRVLARHVGRRIGVLRAARDLTQDQLAERATVSVKYLQRVEAGGENLTLTSLAKFGNLLGVQVPEFFRPLASLKTARGRPRRKRSMSRPGVKGRGPGR